MYMIAVLFVWSGMILLMVMSVFVRFLKVFLCSLLWKVMMMFGGVVFELLVFSVLTARRQVKSVGVMVMSLAVAILVTISFRFSSLVVGIFRIMTCLLGSCRGLGRFGIWVGSGRGRWETACRYGYGWCCWE